MKEAYIQSIKSFAFIVLTVGLTLGFGTKIYLRFGEDIFSYIFVIFIITLIIFAIKLFVAGLDYSLDLGKAKFREKIVKKAESSRQKAIEISFRNNDLDAIDKIIKHKNTEELKAIQKVVNKHLEN